MRRVRRDEVLDWQTYGDVRAGFRERVLTAKAPRRAHLGEHLTLLFENPLTVCYQIQEMVRAEHIVREADIQHEIDTYNEILGGDGELGCTLLMEIDDPKVRDTKLREWWALPERIYMLHEDGSRTYATFDARQRGEGRVSSVQYLRFAVGDRVPVGAGVDLPGLQTEIRFNAATKQALADDLSGHEMAPES